ncbi:MAG: hypothetical protein QM477_06570 [Planctomycetota bacterium]
MGTGQKVAIGCGGFLLLFLLAGFGGWRWLQNNLGMTKDPVEIAQRLDGIGDFTIPDIFEPKFGMYTEAPLINPMLMYIALGDRNQQTSLVIYQREGYLTEDDLLKEVLDGGAGMQIQVGVENLGEEEHFPVTFRGQEYSAKLQEGIDDKQQVERIVLVVMPDEHYTTMVVLHGDPILIHRNLLQTILQSSAAVDDETSTPPMSAGKTSAEDQ